MCVRANAMFSVPRVTMNGGSPIHVTRPPLAKPKATQASRPRAIARTGGTSLSTAIFVMTTEPKAMTAPHERSMPAVRMMIVWPMAIVPITITCWKISEKLSPSRNRSLTMLKYNAGDQEGEERSRLGDLLGVEAPPSLELVASGRRPAHRRPAWCSLLGLVGDRLCRLLAPGLLGHDWPRWVVVSVLSGGRPGLRRPARVSRWSRAPWVTTPSSSRARTWSPSTPRRPPGRP